MRRLRTGRVLGGVLAFGVLAVGCSSDGGAGSPSPATPSRAQVVAIVASVDLYASAPQRVSVGLVTNDNKLVSYGTVDFAFSYVGTADQPQQPEAGPTATATFVPVFGTTGSGDAPRITLPSQGRGIYEASDVTFDRAGFWQVSVSADVRDVGTQRALATFEVGAQASLPAPGDPALATANLTLASIRGDVPAAAVDSRAATEGAIPDPELHGLTIARALREGRPALVVFSTPVYCQSQFCGPVTDMVQDLAKRYTDRAAFIHVEIWKDFENQVLNQAALDWLQMPSGDLTEPWLFLIGADGTIVDRWSSMWSEDEVAAALEALPARG